MSSEDVTFSEVATVNITKSTPLGYTESRNQSGPPYYYSCKAIMKFGPGNKGSETEKQDTAPVVVYSFPEEEGIDANSI